MEHQDLKINLNPFERIDDLNRDGYKIIQSSEGFCFGMDAVLLTGFANIIEGENVLDMCTGTGIIPILLAAKSNARHFTAVEIQERSADMAKRSVELNGLEDRIDIIKGDIKECADKLKKASFDVVTCNPPYMNDSHGLKNPELPKAIARHEVMCTLEDVVKTAATMLKPRGRFYMVHRPHRIAEIICELKKYNLEPKRIRFVYPFVDKDANMVLIEATRGGKPMVKLESPLIVYESQGVYTEEIHRIYSQ